MGISQNPAQHSNGIGTFMAISQRITWRALPQETLNIFTADFNTPVGQYGFTQNVANQGQTVIPTNRGGRATTPYFKFLVAHHDRLKTTSRLIGFSRITIDGDIAK